MHTDGLTIIGCYQLCFLFIFIFFKIFESCCEKHPPSLNKELRSPPNISPSVGNVGEMCWLCPLLQNHRVAWVGEDLKDYQFQPSAMGRAAPYQIRMPRAHPTWPRAPPGSLPICAILWAPNQPNKQNPKTYHSLPKFPTLYHTSIRKSFSFSTFLWAPTKGVCHSKGAHLAIAGCPLLAAQERRRKGGGTGWASYESSTKKEIWAGGKFLGGKISALYLKYPQQLLAE